MVIGRCRPPVAEAWKGQRGVEDEGGERLKIRRDSYVSGNVFTV